MPNIVKPSLTSYGNSFGHSWGNRIDQTKTRGEIITSSLGKIELIDGLEFTQFEKNARDFILAKLGHPVVRVELAAPNIKVALDTAINKLNYHIPYWCNQNVIFPTTNNVNLYELPPYILDNLTYVAYKKSLLSVQNIAGTLEFDYFIKYFQENFLFNDFNVGDFYLLQSHLEMMRKILGNDGSWDIVDGKYLQIFPMPVLDGEEVIIIYRALDSDTMHPYYRNWIHRYATAEAMEILGGIRGKYKTLPSPAGGAQLNGEMLIQQAQKEKEKLELELRTEIEEWSLPSWY